MITRETNENKFLDLPLLTLGEEYDKVCYLHNVVAGKDVTMSGFFRLYLKDIKGNIVVGRLFNVERFEDVGLDMLALKNKPVQIHFRVDEYNGSLSLNIINIKLYTGMFDYASFIGKIDGIEDSFNFVEGAFKKFLNDNSYTLPSSYKTESFRDICDGRCGAYTKILEITLMNLLAMNGIPGIDNKSLITVLNVVQKHYYKYLSDIQALDFITNSYKFQTVNKLKLLPERTNEVLVAEDVLGALIGLNKPESIHSLIIHNTIKEAIDKLNLACIYNTMIRGSVKEVGGVRLLKY